VTLDSVIDMIQIAKAQLPERDYDKIRIRRTKEAFDDLCREAEAYGLVTAGRQLIQPPRIHGIEVELV
jgi:hypothetical protein